MVGVKFVASRYSELLVGVPSIDREHRVLIGLLRPLRYAPPIGGIRSEPFGDILGQIGNQMIEHFDNEEIILKSCGMPVEQVADHVRAHGDIIRQYTELQFDLMWGTPPAYSQVIEMIQAWILFHLLEYDLSIMPVTTRQHLA